MRTTRPALRGGVEKGARRRTIVDDRTGVVVDISQVGSDERPQTMIELYAYPSGHKVVITALPPNPHPWLMVSCEKETFEV